MEGFMSKILQSLVLVVLIFVGLVGCDGESRAAGDTNPARTAGAVRGTWSPPCAPDQPVQEKGICESRENLDDDARTRLCHCRYVNDGIGEAVSGQVLMTGA